MQIIWKCDNQQHYKSIIEADMVSTPDIITGNILLDVGTLGTMKNISTRKSLSQFMELLDSKQKNMSAYWELLKQSASKSGQAVFYGILFRSVQDIKINANVKQALNNWVLHHSQVVQ